MNKGIIYFLFLLMLSFSSIAVTTTDVISTNTAPSFYVKDNLIYHCPTADDLAVCDAEGICSNIIENISTYSCAYVLNALTLTWNDTIAFVSDVDAGTIGNDNITITEITNTGDVYSYKITTTDDILDLTQPLLTMVGQNYIIYTTTAAANIVRRVYTIEKSTGNVLYTFSNTDGTCAIGGCAQPTTTPAGRFRSFETLYGPYYNNNIITYGVVGRTTSVNGYYTRWVRFDDNAGTFEVGQSTNYGGYYVVGIEGSYVYASDGSPSSESTNPSAYDAAIYDLQNDWPMSNNLSQNRLRRVLYDFDGEQTIFDATLRTPDDGTLEADMTLNRTTVWITADDTIIENSTYTPAGTHIMAAMVEGSLVYRSAVGVLSFVRGFGSGPVPSEPVLYVSALPEEYRKFHTSNLAKLLIVNGTNVTYPATQPAELYNGTEIVAERVNDYNIVEGATPEGELFSIVMQHPIQPGPRIAYSTNCDYDPSSLIFEEDDYSGDVSVVRSRYTSSCTITPVAPSTNDPASTSWLYIPESCNTSINVMASPPSGEAITLETSVTLASATESEVNITITDHYGNVIDTIGLRRIGNTVMVSHQEDFIGNVTVLENETYKHDYRVWVSLSMYNDASILTVTGIEGSVINLDYRTAIFPIRKIEWKTGGIGASPIVYIGEWQLVGQETLTIASTSTMLSNDASYWYNIDHCERTADAEQTVRIYYDLIGSLDIDSDYIDVVVSTSDDLVIQQGIAEQDAIDAEIADGQKKSQDWACDKLTLCNSNARLGIAIFIMVLTMIGLSLALKEKFHETSAVYLVPLTAVVIEFLLFATNGFLPTWFTVLAIFIIAILGASLLNPMSWFGNSGGSGRQ